VKWPFPKKNVEREKKKVAGKKRCKNRVVSTRKKKNVIKKGELQKKKGVTKTWHPMFMNVSKRNRKRRQEMKKKNGKKGEDPDRLKRGKSCEKKRKGTAEQGSLAERK